MCFWCYGVAVGFWGLSRSIVTFALTLKHHLYFVDSAVQQLEEIISPTLMMRFTLKHVLKENGKSFSMLDHIRLTWRMAMFQTRNLIICLRVYGGHSNFLPGLHFAAECFIYYCFTCCNLVYFQPCRKRPWNWCCWRWRMDLLCPGRFLCSLWCSAWSPGSPKLPKPVLDTWFSSFTVPPALRWVRFSLFVASFSWNYM